MEVMEIQDELTLSILGTFSDSESNTKFYEVKVRADDDDSYFYLYPEELIGKTVETLRTSGINCDVAEMRDIATGMVPLGEGRYTFDNVGAQSVVAMYSPVAYSEIFELIDFINSNEGKISVKLYKKSELPEFAELLSEKTKSELPLEIQIVLCEYMKSLLDVIDGERLRKIMEYHEQAPFGKLLKLYSGNVQEFMLDHVTKRLEQEIRAQIEE